jgi:hypothetical protein
MVTEADDVLTLFFDFPMLSLEYTLQSVALELTGSVASKDVQLPDWLSNQEYAASIVSNPLKLGSMQSLIASHVSRQL